MPDPELAGLDVEVRTAHENEEEGFKTLGFS